MWSSYWRTSEQANVSIYETTLREVLGINNSEKALSCSGEHTLKCKSLSLFFVIGDTAFWIPRYYAIESNNFHCFSSPHFLSSSPVYFIISHDQLINSPDTQSEHVVTQKMLLFMKNSLPYPKLTGVPAPWSDMAWSYWLFRGDLPFWVLKFLLLDCRNSGVSTC